jgi:hypothetical protein
MSPVCEEFIRAVITQNWRNAFLNLHGLNMFEMLRGLAALDRLDLTDLWAQKNNFADIVNMPRIEYAHEVVIDQRVPQMHPAIYRQPARSVMPATSSEIGLHLFLRMTSQGCYLPL